MFRSFNFVSAVVLWQTISISYAASRDLKDPSEIFREYHTAVVTVSTDRGRGTGFSIDPQEYTNGTTGKTVRRVITAFHVVKGAQFVILHIYRDEKNSEGVWKSDLCPAEVYGIDIARDVALLSIPCDNCNCKRLGALRTRFSTVSAGESILIIGDSAGRRPHSFVDGKLSDTNYTLPLMRGLYRQQANDIKATTKVHGLTGNLNIGDSGSPVMDARGKVIGMMSAHTGDLNLCITMDEINKAKQQILNTLSPRFVGCTAHESALLGRVYWGKKSGKSIREMDALATAMNAQYFAVAHDDVEAHAFTFHVLWWEIFSGNDHKKEDTSQCLCEANSFIDTNVAEHTKAGHVMCGCSENACRMNAFYHKRFGEDNDRRWAIYKTMNSGSGGSGHYVPSRESLALMENIASEIYYWESKADISNEKMEKIKSEDKFYYGIVIATLSVVATIVVFWLYNRWHNTERKLEEKTRKLEETTRKLEEANKECDNLEQQQQQQQQQQQKVPENFDASNLNTAEGTTS